MIYGIIIVVGRKGEDAEKHKHKGSVNNQINIILAIQIVQKNVLTNKMFELSPFSEPLLLVWSEGLPLVLHGPVLTLPLLPQLHALYVSHLKRVEAKEILPCLLSHFRLQTLHT